MEQKEKILYLEALRVLATILVLLNHLPAITVYSLHEGIRRYAFLTVTLIDCIDVPLFFMISGALLFRKKPDTKKLLTVKIPRFALVLFLSVLGIFLTNAAVSVKNGAAPELSPAVFLRGFLEGSIPGTGNYWFLYAYLSLLIMAPFLYPIAVSLRRESFLLLLFLHACACTVLPLLNHFLGAAGQDSLSFSGYLHFPLAVSKPFFYALCGYYLSEKTESKKIKPSRLCLCGLVAVAGIAISIYCTGSFLDRTNEASEQYLPLFDYVSAGFVFLLVRYLFEERFPKLSEGCFASLLRFLGPLCFGIYLLDPFLKKALYPAYSRPLGDRIPGLLFSLGWVTLSFLLCATMTSLLKKIPGIRKLL